MLGQADKGARNDASTQRKKRMRRAQVLASRHRGTAWLLALMFALLSACRPPAAEDSASAEEDGAEVSEADSDGTAAAEDASLDVSERWTIDGLRAMLKDAGWSIEPEAPTVPDVATPEGTKIDGLTIQKGDLRADLFLYNYPRAGYARAHANVEYALEHTAILQREAQLFAVVSRDDAQARAVLDALPLSEGP